MSVKTKKRGRSGPGKPELEALVRDGHATDLTDARHVAKLVAAGLLRLGKKGPLPRDLLRPGPAGPSARKAIDWMMRGR